MTLAYEFTHMPQRKVCRFREGDVAELWLGGRSKNLDDAHVKLSSRPPVDRAGLPPCYSALGQVGRPGEHPLACMPNWSARRP